MNSQDRADLKKYQELKEQRRTASRKYNASHTDEIRARRALNTQMKKAIETKDLSTSLVKTKSIKPVSKPVKEDIDYKTILFTKPKKIMPIKMQKKMQKDDLIFI